jgi:hypothetical protein
MHPFTIFQLGLAFPQGHRGMAADRDFIRETFVMTVLALIPL